jgi:hypothetical protein
LEPDARDGNSDGSAAAGTGDALAGPSSDAPPASLREQIEATIAAVRRLVSAHLALARAEASEIVGEVRRMVALVGGAIGAFVALGLLLAVGLPLFLGEWLFGSIGWGVLIGAMLLLDVAIAMLLLAVDVGGGRIGRDFVLAAVVGIAVGAVLALDLTHRGWTSLGESIAPGLDPGTRPLIVAVVALAIVGGVLGLVGGLRGGGGGAVGGLLAGAIGGAIVGVLTAATIPSTVGAALGVVAALLVWPALSAMEVARNGIDGEAIKRRFTPDETIGMTKETIEWVRARTPLVPKS